MPWLQCGSCQRVLLVLESPPPKYFHCFSCREKNPGAVYWEDIFDFSGEVLSVPDYSEFREKMLRGLRGDSRES